MKSLLLTLVSIFISSSVHAQIAGTVLGENRIHWAMQT